MVSRHRAGLAARIAPLAALLIAGCGGGDSPATPVAAPVVTPVVAGIPQLAAATPAAFSGDCSTLQPLLASVAANTTFTLAATVPAGTVSGALTAEHCRLVGKMNERVSTVDGATYSVGFEVRMPKAWNGRFYYQANGGIDGSIGTAAGPIGGAGATATALSKGFAVLSSNAGHAIPAPFFGMDPQARLDYGYSAVGQLTPMAKNLLKTVYGKAPDRSYLGGCSNGGRHAMVAAARYADQYDGILAGNPGFNLPQAASAQLWGVQQYAAVSTGTVSATVALPGGGTATQSFPDITTSFTAAELNVVGAAVLARCDALDGVADGLVNDVKACQAAFSLSRDVPSCTGARDGTCLSVAQKSVLGGIFAGARNTAGQSIYTNWPFEPGVAGANWRLWKFGNSLTRDPGAVAFIFTAPPVTNTAANFFDMQYAFNWNVDIDAPKIFATSGIYTESPMSFMTPPNPTNLSTLKNRGAKLMVYHGTADPIFSFNDTANWYDGLRSANGGDASNFARMYPVPGMNHCSGGPTTDKFDFLDPLVAWVEQGVAPDTVTASARGGVNTEVPAGWSATRNRPLCVWPKVAKYNGTGDVEQASSFSCQ